MIADLADVLTRIHTEVGNLSISSDGEVRRRIAIAVIDGRILLAELEADWRQERERDFRGEEKRTSPCS